jgi:hypothetical protein
MPRPRGTDDNVTQLKAPGLYKGELFELFSVLPLRHLPGLKLHRKLTLMENDLPDVVLSILTSRG